MNALTKFSIALLPVTATAIAVYLYATPGDEGFDAALSEPQDAICKQDGERLARLRARPSLDEGLRFVGEIRCMQLWPQLQTLLDGLSDPSRSTASSKLDRAASDTTSGSDAALSPGATSATLDDACKHDEDRLAELRANPSVDAAIRFDSELKCPRLKPQLPEILTQLSHAAESVELGNRKAPASDTMSASAAAPPASEPPASEAMAAAEDACKQDEERLAALQAKPSVDEAVRFEDELRCSKLQPQLLALLVNLSQSLQSAGAQSRNGAPSNTTSASEAVPPTPSVSEATSDACKHDEERLAELQAKPSLDEAVRLENEMECLKLQPQLLALLDKLIQAPQSAGAQSPNGAPSNTTSPSEAAPPASEPPTSEAESVTSDDACKQDEERLARLRTTPSSEEAARFAQDLLCETLRPQLTALAGALTKPSPPHSQRVSQDAGAERNATNETQPALQAAVDAERRIAALESEKEALAAKVSRLERDREPPPAEQGGAPAPPPPATPAERSDSEPASQAAADAERRIVQLEGEKEALTAEVSRLQQDRESPLPGPAGSPASPQSATTAEQSESEPASRAVADAERRIAQLESEKDALSAEVSRLQHDHRGSPPAEPAGPPVSPPPAAPAEQSESEPVAALASLPTGMPARVLIRYLPNNADARAQAELLASVLKRQGIEVADLRESRSAIRPELSFAYAPDETIAQHVGRLVGVAPVRRLQPKDGLMVRPGTVELNLSGDSHLAALKTTSTRESNHE
jgi:cell division protein FtsB